MTRSSRSGLLSAAFLGALASAPVWAESGGVYVQAEYDPGLMDAAPKVEFSYDCAEGDGAGTIPPGGDARHCPRAVHASVIAHDAFYVGTVPTEVARFDIDRDDGTPCPDGKSTVWTLVAEVDSAAPQRIAAHSRQESECRD